MNYALIDNNIVTNIIWLHPSNVEDFPGAVPTNNLSVEAGDTYKDGKFYRNGQEIKPDENPNSQELLDNLVKEVSGNDV